MVLWVPADWTAREWTTHGGVCGDGDGDSDGDGGGGGGGGGGGQ